jgi:hypothetical protein
MTPRTGSAVILCAALMCLAPAAAAAQQAAEAGTPGGPSSAWVVVGAASATLRGDCQECEAEFPYRHSSSVLATGGVRVNPRMDVGAEVFWIPTNTSQGRIRTTHVDAIAQFRPWSSSGFFIKGGAGMAFVRNWIDALGHDAVNSKALSVVIGGGWAFRPAGRLGVQLFATQHVAALGDLRTAGEPVENVTGNLWSVGAAIVIR